MSKFHIGQKVVCIGLPWPDHAWIAASFGTQFPEPGKIYTIRWVGVSERDGNAYVRLGEIINPIIVVPPWEQGEARFGARRFRPLVTRKTDISVFTALLNTSKQGVPA